MHVKIKIFIEKKLSKIELNYFYIFRKPTMLMYILK